jgi:hypothetical protein
METQTPVSLNPRPRVRSRASATWLRAGVCAVGMSLATLPALVALASEGVPSALGPSAPQPSDPGAALPNAGPPADVLDPSSPREPNPTGIELPDDVTAGELKGQYTLGLGLLVLGGILTAGVLVALFLALVHRTWSRQT